MDNIDKHIHISLLIPFNKLWSFKPRQAFQQCGMCDKQSLRSGCANAQSDQSLCQSLCQVTDRILFRVSKLNRMLLRLIWVYTCQNATLFEITRHNSYVVHILTTIWCRCIPCSIVSTFHRWWTIHCRTIFTKVCSNRLCNIKYYFNRGSSGNS